MNPVSQIHCQREEDMRANRNIIEQNIQELRQLEKEMDDFMNYGLHSFQQARDKSHLLHQLRHYIPDGIKKSLRTLETTQKTINEILANQTEEIESLTSDVIINAIEPIARMKIVYGYESLEKKKSPAKENKHFKKMNKNFSIENRDASMGERIAHIDLSQDDWFHSLDNLGVGL